MFEGEPPQDAPNRARRFDARAIGLDVGLSFARWLTGREHLHYGLWDGLAPTAANLGAAQEAYTTRLLSHFPGGALRVLDVGGGAGETAARLLAMGHRVEIVVPSATLAARCRENAPAAVVHEMPFEAFEGEGPFDLVLFSESWQYIKQATSLAASARLLAPGGTLLISDCFRADHYEPEGPTRKAGGGHRLFKLRTLLDEAPFELVTQEDLTESVAPSIDIEQGFYNVIGDAIARTDAELAATRPLMRRVVHAVLRAFVSKRRRERLAARLMQRERTSEAFCAANRYMLMVLRRT